MSDEPTGDSGAETPPPADFLRLTFGGVPETPAAPDPEPVAAATPAPPPAYVAPQPRSYEPLAPNAYEPPTAAPAQPTETAAPWGVAPASEPEADGAAEAELVAATTAAGSGKGRRRKEKEHRSFFRELPFLIAIAFVMALVLKAFVVQAFFIPSGSMERTLLVKDRVLVNKVGYHFHNPNRGDIVVFNGKHTNFPPETVIAPASNAIQSAARKVQRFLGLGAPGERDYIKRVIGIGGDQIKCCVNGHVVVNGKELNETYLFEDNQLPFCLSQSDASATVPNNGAACNSPDSKPFVVPKGTLFVMGDHRSASQDSRYEGVIPISSVIGRAFVLVWPFSRLDMFGTPPTFS